MPNNISGRAPSVIHPGYAYVQTQRRLAVDHEFDGRTTTYSEHELEFTFAKND